MKCSQAWSSNIVKYSQHFFAIVNILKWVNFVKKYRNFVEWQNCELNIGCRNSDRDIWRNLSHSFFRSLQLNFAPRETIACRGYWKRRFAGTKQRVLTQILMEGRSSDYFRFPYGLLHCLSKLNDRTAKRERNIRDGDSFLLDGLSTTISGSRGKSDRLFEQARSFLDSF